MTLFKNANTWVWVIVLLVVLVLIFSTKKSENMTNTTDCQPCGSSFSGCSSCLAQPSIMDTACALNKTESFDNMNTQMNTMHSD